MHKNCDSHWILLKLMIHPDALSDQDIAALKTYFLADPKKVLRDIGKNVIALRLYENLIRKTVCISLSIDFGSKPFDRRS